MKRSSENKPAPIVDDDRGISLSLSLFNSKCFFPPRRECSPYKEVKSPFVIFAPIFGGGGFLICPHFLGGLAYLHLLFGGTFLFSPAFWGGDKVNNIISRGTVVNREPTVHSNLYIFTHFYEHCLVPYFAIMMPT